MNRTVCIISAFYRGIVRGEFFQKAKSQRISKMQQAAAQSLATLGEAACWV
jgi:hypothetical protein